MSDLYYRVIEYVASYTSTRSTLYLDSTKYQAWRCHLEKKCIELLAENSPTILTICYKNGKWFKDGINREQIVNVKVGISEMKKSFALLTDSLHIVKCEFDMLITDCTYLILTMRAVSGIDGASVSWKAEKIVSAHLAVALYLVSTCDDSFHLTYWPFSDKNKGKDNEERSFIIRQCAFTQLRKVVPVDSIVVLVIEYWTYPIINK